MHCPNAQPELVFGFLSTLETVEFGYFGGYLIVNGLGRPLEFHCTAPVRPSRAQEILYGPTLQPFLLGEQMGGALVREAKLRPDIVLTDQPAMLILRNSLDWPLVMLATQSAGAPPALDISLRLVSEHHRAQGFVASGYQIQLPDGFDSDQPRASELLTVLAEHVELAEPFDRIREAIREASRIGDRGQEPYGQAAA